MAIRYDANYNAKIARVVKNFNQKRNRAIKRGFKSVPAPIKVSDLKARYTTRKDLDRQLDVLAKFSHGRDAVLKRVENQGGARAIEWEFEYLKSNEQAAREFYLREYKRVAPKTVDFPGEKQYLDNIAAKINIIDLDVAYMSQSQFNSYKSAIMGYINKPKNYAGSYRGFLKEVEIVMKMLNFSERQINSLFDKFSVLTPEQFHNMYNDSELVARIYRLVNSPTTGAQYKLTTTEDDARELIDTLNEEADDLVKKAQQEPEWMKEPFEFDPDIDSKGFKVVEDEFPDVTEFSKAVKEVKRLSKVTRKHMYPKSKLSKEDIEMLKALGADDLIDENR